MAFSAEMASNGGVFLMRHGRDVLTVTPYSRTQLPDHTPRLVFESPIRWTAYRLSPNADCSPPLLIGGGYEAAGATRVTAFDYHPGGRVDMLVLGNAEYFEAQCLIDPSGTPITFGKETLAGRRVLETLNLKSLIAEPVTLVYQVYEKH